MKASLVLGLCLLVVGWCAVADAADKKKAQAVSEYCHICEAASRISIELLVMLAKYPYEGMLGAYAAKIADANEDVLARLKAPDGAEAVSEHFVNAVAAFKKAVVLHRKGEYKAADEAGTECKTAFWKAVAEVQKLRKDGVIP